MKKITKFKIIGYYIGYFPIFILIELVSILIFLYPRNILFLNYVVYIIGFTLVAFSNILIIHSWFKINEKYILNSPENYQIKDGKNYIGIVIVNSNLPNNKLIFIYGAGLILFLEYLIDNHLPFKLIKEKNPKEKFNKNKFRELIYDKNCTELYILGHGRRHSLKISKKEFLYYMIYSGAPNKNNVVQLHCNLGNYVSLSELLKADKDFKEKGSRWLTQNVVYFLKKIKK